VVGGAFFDAGEFFIPGRNFVKEAIEVKDRAPVTPKRILEYQRD